MSDIQKNGAKQVYQQLKLDSGNLSFVNRHNLAHIFGKALYRVEKDMGVAVCDPDMSFGCYHGLFTEAIITEGISSIPKLDYYCKQAGKNIYTACQHGIGHGLVEYYGRNQISKAMESCNLIQKNRLVGCSSGVFMEYLLPSALGDNSKEFPKINPDNPFEVCTSLGDSKFLDSCIYELPRLWRYTQTNFDILTKWCLSLENHSYQKSCYRGLGHATGNTNNPQPKFSLSICKMIINTNSQLYCLSGATWFYDTLHDQEISNEAKILCESSADKQMCLKLSDLHLDMF